MCQYSVDKCFVYSASEALGARYEEKVKQTNM